MPITTPVPVRTTLGSASREIYSPEALAENQQFEIANASEFGRGWESAGLSERANSLRDQANNAYRSGDQRSGEVLEMQAGDLEQQASQWAPTVKNFTDVRGLRSGLDWAGGAMGNLRSSVAPALGAIAGAGVGLAAKRFTGGMVNPTNAGFLGGAAAGYDTEANDAVAQAMNDPTIRANKSMQEIKDAGRVYGAGSAMLEAGVPALMTGKLLGTTARAAVGKGAGGAATQVAKVVGQGAAGEFATEFPQDLAGQATQNTLLDKPVTDFDYTQAFNEGMAGAVAGGGMGVVGGVADVAHARVGAGVDKVNEVRKDPVGAVADAIADAGNTAGKALAGGVDLFERMTSQPHRALDSLVGPDKAGADLNGPATEWAQHVLTSPESTEQERADASAYVTGGNAELYRNKLTIAHHEAKQSAGDTAIADEIAERTGSRTKKSLMRANPIPFGDSDPTTYNVDEDGRSFEVNGARTPHDLTGKVSAPNTTLSTSSLTGGDRTRATYLGAEAKRLAGQAETVGQPVQPKGPGVKGVTKEQLESSADIWRKQGVNEKLLNATSELTDVKQREMSIAVFGWLQRGFKDVDGNVFVPESLIKQHKGKTAEVIKSAAKSAFEQGVIGHDEARMIPEIMQMATLQHADATAVNDAVLGAIPDYARGMWKPRLEELKQVLRQAAEHGTTKAQEAGLMQVFGSKEAIAQAMSKLTEKKSAYGTSKNDLQEGEVSEEEKEAAQYGMTLSDVPQFVGVDKDNAPFDSTNPAHAAKLLEATKGKRSTTREVGLWDRIKSQYAGDLNETEQGELRDAEDALLDEHGAAYLKPKQLEAMEEYGVSAAETIASMNPKARDAILNKINKRFTMLRKSANGEAQAADAIELDQVNEFKESYDPRGPSALVTQGALFLERSDVKTAFPTSAYRLAKHAWTSADGSKVEPGLGMLGIYQDVLATVGALMEADPRFTGRVGYKTELGSGEPTWLGKNDSLPADFKLPGGELAEAKAEALAKLKKGDKEWQSNFATTPRAMYSSLREFQGRESTSKKFADFIGRALSPLYRKDGVEQTKEKADHVAEVTKLYWDMRSGEGEWGSNYNGVGEAPQGSNVEREAAGRKLRATDEFKYASSTSQARVNTKTSTGEPTKRDLTKNRSDGKGNLDQRSHDDSITPSDALSDESVKGTSRASDPVVKNDDATIRRTARGDIAGGAPEGSVEGHAPLSASAAEPTDAPLATVKNDEKPLTSTPAEIKALGQLENMKESVFTKLRVSVTNLLVAAKTLSDDQVEVMRTALGFFAKMGVNVTGADFRKLYDKALTNEQAAAIVKRARNALKELDAMLLTRPSQETSDGQTAAKRDGANTARTNVESKDGSAQTDQGRNAAVSVVGQAEGTGQAGRTEAGVAAGEALDDAIYNEDYGQLDSVEKLMALARYANQRDKELEARDEAGDALSEKEEGVWTLAGQLVFDAKSYLKKPDSFSGMDFESFFDGVEHTDADVDAFVKALAGSKKNAQVVLPHTSPFTAKDQAKSDKANKFIGQGSGKSSTLAYAKAWGERANSGKYAATDRVFVSVEGARDGRVSFDKAEFNKAVDAGATIVADDKANRERSYNVGERELAEHLAQSGYVEKAPGEWVPGTKQSKMVTNIADKRWERTKARAEKLIDGMSDEDFNTLQNDVLSRDPNSKSLIPSKLKEQFDEWLGDSYGAVERETRMAPENQGETETHFLEELVDNGPENSSPHDVAMAEMILRKGGFSRENAQAAAGKPATKAERDAAAKHLTDTLGDTVERMFKSSFKDGSSGSWTPTSTKSVIRLALNSDVLGTAYHESMHELFSILGKHGGENVQQLLQRVAVSGPVMRKLEHLLKDHKEALAQLADPEEAAAYMYQFWRAGTLTFGPKVETLFEKIKKFLAGVLGKVQAEVKDQAQAELIMAAFTSGVMKDGAAHAVAVKALSEDTARHEAALTRVGEYYKKFADVGGKYFYSAEGMMEATKNKHVGELATLFNQKAGAAMKTAGNVVGTFFDAVPRTRAQYMNKLENILQQPGLDKADIELVREALATGKASNIPRIQKVVEQMHGFNQEMMDYIGERDVRRLQDGKWVKVEKRADFGMPQVWDVENVINNADALKVDLLKTHLKELQGIARQANKEMADSGNVGAKLGPAAAAEAAKAKENNTAAQIITPEMVADAIVQRIMNSGGKIDLEENSSDLGMTPLAASVNQRALSWIDKEVFDKYKQKDLLNIYSTYVTNMTKRGEYVARFGNGGEKIRTLTDKAFLFEMGGDKLVTQAVSALKPAIKQWAKAREAAMQAGQEFDTPVPTLRTVGNELHGTAVGNEQQRSDMLKAAKALHNTTRAVQAMEGTLGVDISPGLRNLNGILITYQSLRLLSGSLFTSMADVVGIPLNGGTMKDAWDAFVRGMREVKLSAWDDSKSSDEAAQRAELWGSVDAVAFNDAIGQGYGGMYLTGKAKKFSDHFFRKIGMEGWNRAMRISATLVGERIITDWSAGKIDMSDKAAKARIERLYGEGATAADIKLGPDGRPDINDARNQAAISRFVNDSVMRPNAAQRPIWGSDPHYAALWHLKSFTWTQHKVILEGIIAQAKLGNYRPALVGLVGYTPVAIAAGAMKEMLVPGEEPPWMKGGLDSYLQYGFDRSGLGGVPLALYGNLKDPASWFGPTVDEVQGFVSIPLLDNHTFGQEAAGALPFGNFLRRAAG